MLDFLASKAPFLSANLGDFAKAVGLAALAAGLTAAIQDVPMLDLAPAVAGIVTYALKQAIALLTGPK